MLRLLPGRTPQEKAFEDVHPAFWCLGCQQLLAQAGGGPQSVERSTLWLANSLAGIGTKVLLLHGGQNGFRQHESRSQLILDAQGEFLPGHLLKWFEDAGWTGAVDENVDATVDVAGCLNQGFCLMLVPDVSLNGESLSAVGVNLRNDLRGCGRVFQIIDDHAGSTCGQQGGCGSSKCHVHLLLPVRLFLGRS